MRHNVMIVTAAAILLAAARSGFGSLQDLLLGDAQMRRHLVCAAMAVGSSGQLFGRPKALGQQHGGQRGGAGQRQGDSAPRLAHGLFDQ